MVNLVTAQDLFNAGRQFALTLQGNETITLSGVMGVGKTHFVKGCCLALGVAEGLVTSPTFALIHQYQGKFAINHIDLYRLQSAEEFELIGGFELLGRGVSFIEWPNLIKADLPSPLIELEFTLNPDGSRSLKESR